MASGRLHISGALKAAVAASVLGISGLVAAPSASASVLTVELVPTSATNGNIVGTNEVDITTTGTINFNIVAVLHSQNSTQADDGVNQLGLSLQSDSPNVIGNLTTALNSTFAAGTAQAGTPTTASGTSASSGPDIGPDRAGGAATTGTSLIFYAQTPSGSASLGTAATTGDLSEIVGSGTLTVTTVGSTNVVPVLHVDSNGLTPGRTEKFTVDNVSYILNGDGHGTVGGVTGTDATLMNVQGFSVVATPEPGSLALLGLGGLGLLMRRRRN